MKIGVINSCRQPQQGFSYIELMTSLLIIGAAFVGYMELITRIKFTQQNNSIHLQAIMQNDYQGQNTLVNHSVCAKP